MVNDELIGKVFTASCAGILPTYLSEAETEDYPYLVYSQSVTPILSKDGVIGYGSELTAHVYSNDFDEAEAKADVVAGEVNGVHECEVVTDSGSGSGSGSGSYTIGIYFQPASLDRSCVDGIWDISMTWNVRQMNI